MFFRDTCVTSWRNQRKLITYVVFFVDIYIIFMILKCSRLGQYDIIRYFSFNILRSHPAVHIEGFNIHAFEGAIHTARLISFVAVATICIHKTNIILTSPEICIELTICWSMSNALRIAVYNIVTMCASMHITPINKNVIVFFNNVLLRTIRIELPSLNYFSLGQRLLLWKAG